MNTPRETRLQGLSAAQARGRLERDGPNELPRANRRTLLPIALDVVTEPMLAMLLAAGAIYLLLGDRTEALVLTLFAGLSILITIVQEARTERVLEALRDLSAPRALVIRDGETRRIPGREVVEGDLLVLEQGDRIAADALMLEARELESDESLLTGESVPVRKRAAEENESAAAEPGGDDLPLVFAGTIVTRGAGLARVIATGTRSSIGKIGHSLATVETEAPHLKRETSRIVVIAAGAGMVIAAIVVLLYGFLRGSWLDAFLAGIATAMSMLPEEFPVVLTIFLAMGAWRIARAGVLTRRTTAIETMGAATVLCTDKTGTLTQNRMTVARVWLPESGHAAIGEGTGDDRHHQLLEASALASAPTPVDPMEVAFHEAARDAGHPAGNGRQLVHSYALRPELLAMSNVWQSPEDGAPLVVAAKGAPEAIAALCRLDGKSLRELEEAARSMAEQGMRVLGVATADAKPADTAKPHEAHAFRLLGLAGLSDPLRADVPEAVAQCRSAGIRVVMITGDYPATARAIAAEAGIEGELMTGTDVAALSDEALAAGAGQIAVFARIMPEQKLRIVKALKAAGEVVAMTGDGVNDAPALKAAHIGVAMGKRGTDVAREAAAIVLVEDDFGAIVSAIRLGRRIYDNIRKALGFIFGVHVPIAGLAILPLTMGLPVILGPLQIALLEMVIDPICALVFEAEREEERLMQRPPRDPAERLFSASLVTRGLLQGGMAFAVLAALFVGAHWYGMPVDRLRTLTFFALIAAILALVIANRSFGVSLGHLLPHRNRIFGYIAALIVAVSALILTVPAIQSGLKFTSLGAPEFGLVALTGILLLGLFELTKGRQR